MNPEPFKIDVAEATLEDLQNRLGQTRWPDEIAGSEWDFGASLAYLKELVSYWQEQFDWRAQERELNTFAHFRAKVDDLSIHFIHERGKGPAPVPLVITHGWPGSFFEMLKIVPLLTDPESYGGDENDSFDVVVPSMPGYGFSDRPSERGFNVFRIAELWTQLMGGLGYSRFGAQGGDWGASVATCLGLKHAEQVIGLHLNYIPGSYRPYLDFEDSLHEPRAGHPCHGLSEEEKTFLDEQEKWVQTEGAYGHVQATKPQTLAYGLNDSPAGLAAWIVEKFRDWSDCDGEVERRFTKDELLTNVMIYWVTETIHSSTRLYYEGRRRPLHFGPTDKVGVPCAVARFAKEAPFPPRAWVERGYNIQQWTEVRRGGHFAAMEEPELLVEDIRTFFRSLR